MMAFSWPFALAFQSQSWMPSGASRTGGRSLTGSQQVVRTDAGFWTMRATLAFTSVGRRRGEPLTLAYRAMTAGLEGMAGEIDVPCVTPWRPYDQNGSMLNHNAAAALDGLGLFDHSGFGQTEPDLYRAAAPADLRATRLTVEFDTPEGIRPGHFFGIGHRLYLVSAARPVTEAEAVGTGGTLMFGDEEITFGEETLTYGEADVVLAGDNTQEIEFWPPLREAVAAGTQLILGRPVCRMRLASDETGALEHTPGGVAAPTLEFVEAI